MFGTTQLQPGDYVIRGKESQPQLEILQHDKVVATVPCQWIRLDQKAHQVTEVQFAGRNEAAKIGS
jgi:hypothetical protein